MQASATNSQPEMAPTFDGLNNGLLYCVASLVLGIELNLLGPTVSSLAAQVGMTVESLGPGEDGGAGCYARSCVLRLDDMLPLWVEVPEPRSHGERTQPACDG